MLVKFMQALLGLVSKDMTQISAPGKQEGGCQPSTALKRLPGSDDRDSGAENRTREQQRLTFLPSLRANYNDSKSLHSIYCVPGTVISIQCFSSLIPLATL